MASQEVLQSPGAAPRFFYGYIVVGAAFLIMVAIWGTYNSFGVFFKPVLTEFGWTRAMTSGAYSLSFLMQGFFGIGGGRLTDRFGARVVMTACGLFLGLGYVLMSQISAVWQLYLFYGVIVGTGMGGAWIPLMSTAAKWFVKNRSMMTGIVTAGIGVGTMIVPPAASRLVSTYGWRTSYIIVGIIALVFIILASQFLRRDPGQIGQVPFGANQVKEKSADLESKGFSLQEAIQTRQFWIVCAIFFCFGFCSFTITVHIVPHATELGISAASAANILATFGGLSIVGKVALGNAADRIGNRQIFIIGFILMSATLFWLAPAKEAWILYSFAAIFGLAYGGCAASESPLVAVLFGLTSHGLILGVIGFGFTLGAAVGPVLAGRIFDMTSSYQVAFLVSAAIGIVGLILTVLLTPTKAR